MSSVECGNCHDNIFHKVALPSSSGKHLANRSATPTTSCTILVDRVEAKGSSILRRFLELVDECYGDVIALVDAGDGPADPHHNTAGIGNFPIGP